MKKIAAVFAAASLAGGAALLSFASLTGQPQPPQQPSPEQKLPSIPTCNGAPFSGEYLVKPFDPAKARLPEYFNAIAGEKIVGSVRDTGVASDYVVVAPADLDMPCDSFMEIMQDTGVIDHIDPDYLVFPVNNFLPQ